MTCSGMRWVVFSARVRRVLLPQFSQSSGSTVMRSPGSTVR